VSPTDRSIVADSPLARTRAHYEEFPFIQGGEARTALWKSRTRQFLDDATLDGALVLDVGSSTGEVALALCARGAEVVCLDLTHRALRVARDENGLTQVCQGDAVHQPFGNGIFDVAIAIGVLHHTPDCRRALEEMARVTRPGGRVVVLLYSRYTPYHALYLLAAPMRRWIAVGKLHRAPICLLRLFRPMLAFQVGQTLDDEEVRRLIADQIWTPQATFHTARQVRRWATSSGLRHRSTRAVPLYANWLAFERDNSEV
jgi:SAM-dependent methyltransferase